MTYSIRLNDDSIHTLTDIYDFEYLIDLYLGYDARCYFKDNIVSEIEGGNGLDSELDAYEAQVDGQMSEFREILSICEQLQEDFEGETGKNKKSAIDPYMKKIGIIANIAGNQF